MLHEVQEERILLHLSIENTTSTTITITTIIIIKIQAQVSSWVTGEKIIKRNRKSRQRWTDRYTSHIRVMQKRKRGKKMKGFLSLIFHHLISCMTIKVIDDRTWGERQHKYRSLTFKDTFLWLLMQRERERERAIVGPWASSSNFFDTSRTKKKALEM